MRTMITLHRFGVFDDSDKLLGQVDRDSTCNSSHDLNLFLARSENSAVQRPSDGLPPYCSQDRCQLSYGTAHALHTDWCQGFYIHHSVHAVVPASNVDVLVMRHWWINIWEALMYNWAMCILGVRSGWDGWLYGCTFWSQVNNWKKLYL